MHLHRKMVFNSLSNVFKDSVKKTKIPVEQSVRWGEETLRRRKTALVHWS
ncbi:hypothetical protein [Paenibacillus tundrae]|nr:hypothetical protein [Paenibacillus tundrae]